MTFITRLVFCACLVAASLCWPGSRSAAQPPPTASGKDTASPKASGPGVDVPQEPTTLPAAWIGISIVVVLALVGALWWSGARPQDPYIRRLGPSFFFWLGILYLGVLLSLAGLYITNCFGFMDALQPIGRFVPLCVPWFGALGAVVISLQGVFDHNDDWDPSYNYWHIGRPLFGAVVGIVAYFLLQLTVAASGAQPATGAAEHNTVFYCVGAFLVGYREATFRELLKRVVDLILQPAPAAAPIPAVTFKVGTRSPLVIDCGRAAPQDSTRVVVEILNTGNAPLTMPSVTVTTAAPNAATVFRLENDHLSGNAELAPGQSGTVDVVFTPSGVGAFSGTLKVMAANLSAPKTIDLSGTGAQQAA
jgi:hypothetical protein